MYQLLLQAKAGDAEAEDELLVQVFAFAVAIVHNRLRGFITIEDAEGIASDTALYVKRRLFSITAQNNQQLKRLIAKIAIHRTLDAIRRTNSQERVQRAATAIVAEHEESSSWWRHYYDSDWAAGAVMEMTERFISEMEPQDQEIIRLRVYDYLEWEAVGGAVNLCPDNARIRFGRRMSACVAYLRKWVARLPGRGRREVVARFPKLKPTGGTLVLSDPEFIPS